MGNTQEELEASVLLGSYNLVAITETWEGNIPQLECGCGRLQAVNKEGTG